MTVGWNWRKRWEFKFMQQCICACSSEIGKYRFMMLRENLHTHKKQQKKTKKQKTTKIHVSWSNLAKRLCVYMYILITMQKKNFQNNCQTYRHCPFKLRDDETPLKKSCPHHRPYQGNTTKVVYQPNRIGGVIVSVLASSSDPSRVKPKSLKPVFVASPLSTVLRRKSEDW